MNLVEGRDDLVVDVVDHVAADGGDAIGRMNVDVHGAFGVGVGGIAIDARHQFNRTGQFEIEEAQRALGVEAVDQMLDVGRRILRMHQSGDGVFQLLAIEHDRRVHRKQIVLAGMIDVQMGVADVADVAHAHAVARELVLDHVLVELKSAHAQRFHDLVGAVAGVDHDRIGTADDQEAQRQDAAGPAAIAAKHEKTRFQFDISIVQNLDFKRHMSLSPNSLIRSSSQPINAQGGCS